MTTKKDDLLIPETEVIETEDALQIMGAEDEAGQLEFNFVEEPPFLVLDTDPERAVGRQKEMMDACFGGIGEEKKEAKRMGLAMQQLDIEQRHALRLLLSYQDPAKLAAHLERCLADPGYGYGERGDNGRTVAQAMAALAGEELAETDLAPVVAAWLEIHQDFQQQVLGGMVISFSSLFDFADLDTFTPVLQRVGETTWRLGVEGEGKHRDFEGPVADIWPHLCDAYVQWCDADNEAWLARLKQKAAKLPDVIGRAAWADRLRKETYRVEVQGSQVILTTKRSGEDWPRSLTLGDQIGLSRLSGHSFYELAWDGGLHVRRFEISGATRRKVPFEHIEVALRLAEALGVEQDLSLEPVTAVEVEAAYLRRMKAKGAKLGPPELAELPPAIQGQPAASYKVGQVLATMLHGGQDVAYITAGETAIVLRRDEKRAVLAALPVLRGRPQRGNILMTTPLNELDLNNPAWRRAVCAWGAWLGRVVK